MKIAIVTPFIKTVGGVEIFNLLLKDVLCDSGHEVTIIGRELIKDNFWNRRKVGRKGPEHVIGDIFNAIHKKINFDMVICNGEYGVNVNHPDTINVFHGSYYGYYNAIREFITKEQYAAGMKLSDMQVESAKGKFVVTVSGCNKTVLTEQGIKVDKVIRNAVDTEIFRPTEDNKVIEDRCLFISRYDYYAKGIDIIEKLAEKGIRMMCVSDKKITHPNIIYNTYIGNYELPKLYNKSSCLVFPSRFEGGGIVFLEAMACGCPVIVRPVGYGVDIKREIPEFVVEGEDMDEYIEKIKLVTGKRDYYGNKAVEFVMKFHSLKKFRDEWSNLVNVLFK